MIPRLSSATEERERDIAACLRERGEVIGAAREANRVEQS